MYTDRQDARNKTRPGIADIPRKMSVIDFAWLEFKKSASAGDIISWGVRRGNYARWKAQLSVRNTPFAGRRILKIAIVLREAKFKPHFRGESVAMPIFSISNNKYNTPVREKLRYFKTGPCDKKKSHHVCIWNTVHDLKSTVK